MPTLVLSHCFSSFPGNPHFSSVCTVEQRRPPQGVPAENGAGYFDVFAKCLFVFH